MLSELQQPAGTQAAPPPAPAAADPFGLGALSASPSTGPPPSAGLQGDALQPCFSKSLIVTKSFVRDTQQTGRTQKQSLPLSDEIKHPGMPSKLSNVIGWYSCRLNDSYKQTRHLSITVPLG